MPPLNLLHLTKARSSLAVLVTAVGTLAPLLPEGWREVAADADGLMCVFDAATAAVVGIIDAVNVLLVLGGIVWLWWERRAPNFRLSFSDP